MSNNIKSHSVSYEIDCHIILKSRHINDQIALGHLPPSVIADYKFEQFLICLIIKDNLRKYQDLFIHNKMNLFVESNKKK